MVNVSQLKGWNPGALHEIVTTMRQRQQVLVHSGDDFGGVLPVAGWSGEAAEAASGTHQHLVGQLETMAATASFVMKGLDQASDAIPPVQRQLENMDNVAQKYGFTIGDDGSVTDTFAPGQAPPELHPQDRVRAKQEISDGVGQALRTAEDIGHDLTQVLQRAERGEVPTGNGGPGGNTVAAAADAGTQAMALTVPEPPQQGSPQQVADWWGSLSTSEQRAVVQNNPGWIGNRNGVPAAARSQANMNQLPAIKGRLRDRVEQLRTQLDHTPTGGDYQTRGMHRQARKRIQSQLDDVEGKLTSLDSIGNTVAQSQGQPEGQRYYLLGADPSGNGKAILAKGNPDTAQNVATYVPGTGSKLAGFSDEQRKANAMYDEASQSGAKTSVITWQGYEAPEGLSDAASSEYADNGKRDFNDFQQGLRASHHGGPSHNVAVGHSYGSTLIGHAARDGNVAADDLVFVGSPGVGVDHANQLNVPPDHVYATEAKNDIIRQANQEYKTEPGQQTGVDPIHGPDPTGNDFGGRSFAADPGTEGSWGGVSTDAHSEYWDRNNPSLINMGNIINGQPPNAH